MKYWIVWNEAKTEGFVTVDKQLAYEARKGAYDNCFDVNGTRRHLAQMFCDCTYDENCTIQEVEL